jgi:hypothetical protein
MAKGWMGFMIVYSPCEEGEGGGGDGWGAIACNNRIESVGRWVGEEPHLVMRIDGLDRVIFEDGDEEECPLSGVVVEGFTYLSRRGDVREPVQSYPRYTRSGPGRYGEKARKGLSGLRENLITAADKQTSGPSFFKSKVFWARRDARCF